MAAAVSADGHEVFTGGATRRLDVRSIEKELTSLWKAAVEASETDGRTPLTRAAVLTLVIVVDGGDAATRFTDLVAALTEFAPCRAILIQRSSEEAHPPISAFASAHCHRVAGGRQVCCEQVTITVSPSAVRLLPGLVTPLFIPDLPAFVYWPEAMAQTSSGDFPDLMEMLFPQVDYIVVDSGRACDPLIAMTRLADLIERPGAGRPRPRDLNWTRLLPWREAVADLFEPPERRGWPAAVSAVTIRAAAGGEGDRHCFPSRPMLLAAWLSGRLGWTRTGAEAHGERFRIDYTGGRFIDILLDGGDEPRGRLEELDCSCGAGRRAALTRRPDGHLALRLEADGHVHEEMLIRRAETEEALLSEEITHRERDAVFEAAMLESAELVRASLHGAMS